MPQKPGSIIKTDDFLAVNEYIRSDNGLFYACMQDDGNFCVYRGIPGHQHKHFWGFQKTETGKKFVAVMQSDANFTVSKGTSARDRQPPFASSQKNLQPPGGKYFAVMQDDGNFCVYKGTGPRDRTGEALWCSDKMDRPKQPVLDSKSIIKYDMAAAKTRIAGQLDLYQQIVDNIRGVVDQSGEISGSETITEEFGFSNSLGVSVEVSTEFKCGLPGLVDGKVAVTVTGSYEHTWSTSNSRSKTWSFSVPVVAPPGTKIAAEVKATKSTIDVPYSTDVLVEYESGTKLRLPLEGMYSGSSTHSLTVTFKQVGVALAKVKPVTKKIENATAEYS
ncbi:MAG: aerolysin family beta-barrel pore-forming toxin [Geminicoccaceae bacterium]